ncbi:MAG: NUDIX domain-containing protein [Candidatus Saccharibacteria bacterium]|nr:NUDIX domain-containing protein [Candidatus Saccharibacteria bacterium]
MTNNNDDYPLTAEEFQSIYSKVPRLTVEVVVKSENGVLLTLRDIEPFKGQWHIPGGTVYFNEKLTEAVTRIAKKELGIQVTSSKLINYLEYPSHISQSFDSPVGLAFLVEYSGKIELNHEASDAQWFKELPVNIHPEQCVFLRPLL